MNKKIASYGFYHIELKLRKKIVYWVVLKISTFSGYIRITTEFPPNKPQPID